MKKIAYFLLEDGIYCECYNNQPKPEQQGFPYNKNHIYTMESYNYDDTEEYTPGKYYQLIGPKTGYKKYYPGNSLGRKRALCDLYWFPNDILLYTYVKHNEYFTTKISRFCSHKTGHCYGEKFYGSPLISVSNECASILASLGIGK